MLCVREHGVAKGARAVGWISVQEHAFCYWVFICTILDIHHSGTVYIAVFRKTIVASGPNRACGEAAGWNDLDLTDDGQGAAHDALSLGQKEPRWPPNRSADALDRFAYRRYSPSADS
jgi:hypothetical protein